MSIYSELKEQSLMSWRVAALGFSMGLISKAEISAFASDALSDENCIQRHDDIALLALPVSDSPSEFEKSIDALSSLDHSSDEQAAIEALRLGSLKNILCSQDSEQEKIDRLQEVYADFDYPEDMEGCSIYSAKECDPLIEANNVVLKLLVELKAS